MTAVRLLSRALGVIFFSLLSIGIAFYAFLALPQVQDLLFDARPYLVQEIVYWAGFYFVGIFLWALPLVFTARLLLLQNFDVIGVDTEKRFIFYIFRLPTLLVVFAFLAVLAGVVEAGSNLPALTKDGGNAAEAPVRQFLEQHLVILFVATAAVLVLVIARNFFILGYGRRMRYLEERDPARFKATVIRFERLSRKHIAHLEDLDIHLSALKPAYLSMETWIAAQRVKVFMWRYLSGVTLVLLGLVAIHFLSYSDLIQRWLTIPNISSYPQFGSFLQIIADTIWLKRAAFIFVIFGAWLPFAAILSLLSNRYQFPFITSLIVIGTALTLFFSDGHDARILTIPEADQNSLRPVEFADAVRSWKASSGWDAKGCETLASGAPELSGCPRPILVSGEGGGSRAAFLIASVLGNLEDESLKQAKSNPAARPFHNQLFAISSVSGSSVGAAFYLGALQMQSHVALPDLKNALYRQRLWFLNVSKARTPENDNFLTDVVTYKDALQAALSNDFISPAMIAYLARDVLILSRLPYVMDRAGVLETAWEDAFDSVYSVARETSPLSAPLQSFTPGAGVWTPLLFFNTTSIETGRRVIVTPVKMGEALQNGKSLFIDAYDAHEFFCSAKDASDLRTLDRVARFLPSLFSPAKNATCTDSGKPTSVDFRLSTAAGLSSRSPFISPHASIRDNTAQIVDSVVDGGYFDNSGAVTALEIANALKVVDSRLQPFILQVSSEPDWFKNTKECGQTDEIGGRPAIPDEADFKPLGTLGDVLTVNATRVARGYETILQMPAQIARINGDVRSEAQIYICPQRKESFFWDKFVALTTASREQKEEAMERSIVKKTRAESAIGWKSISLSWWLSPPLQAYLDGQIYAKHNTNARECVVTLLRDQSVEERARCG